MTSQSILQQRDSELTLKMTKEALKAIEQRLKIEEEDSAIEGAHGANTRKGKGPPPKYEHCGKIRTNSNPLLELAR